jgi:hypothetical protein
VARFAQTSGLVMPHTVCRPLVPVQLAQRAAFDLRSSARSAGLLRGLNPNAQHDFGRSRSDGFVSRWRRDFGRDRTSRLWWTIQGSASDSYAQCVQGAATCADSHNEAHPPTKSMYEAEIVGGPVQRRRNRSPTTLNEAIKPTSNRTDPTPSTCAR